MLCEFSFAPHTEGNGDVLELVTGTEVLEDHGMAAPNGHIQVDMYQLAFECVHIA